MKKRLALLCTLLFLSQALLGCAMLRMERQTFPLCMAIDQLEDGLIRIAVQAPQSGSSGGDAKTPKYEIISATGTSIGETLHLLSASTPYPINYSQLELCILGYQLASTSEVRAILRELSLLITMRPTAVVSVSLGSALEIISQQKPDFGMRLSTHYEILFDHLRSENLLPDSSLASLVRGQGEGRRDHLLCLCAVNPQLVPKTPVPAKESKTDEGGGGSPAFSVGEPWADAPLPENIVAGTLAHTSSNPVEFLGAATLGDSRVSGYLTAAETQLVVRAHKETTRRIAIHGDRLQLQVLIPAQSSLTQNQSALLSAIQKLQQLHCDALGFGGVSAGVFWSDAAWQAFQFKSKYPSAEVIVTPQ